MFSNGIIAKFTSCIHYQMQVCRYSFIFICVHVCAHVFVCMCDTMLLCMWRPEVDVGCLFNRSPPCFVRHNLSPVLEFTHKLESSSEPRGLSCLCLPSTGIASVTSVHSSLWGCCRPRLGFSSCTENTLLTEPSPQPQESSPPQESFFN